MAKSGSIVITQGTQEIANNRTYITVTGKITTSGESWRGDYNTGTYTIKQGSTVLKSGSFTHGAPANSTTTLFSVSLWVTHDANGNSGTITATYNYDSGWCTGTASKTLTTIPRKSDLSVANGTLGTAQTLTVTRKSTSFSHSIKVVCGSVTRYIKADGTLSTTEVKHTDCDISFTPPIDWASQNTAGKAVSIVYTITTYNGSTSIGSNPYTKTCSIPESVKPGVTLTVKEATDLQLGLYVQGVSKLEVVVTPTTAYGSAIDSYKTTVGSNAYTTNSFTTGLLTTPGDLTIETTITDKRGRMATATKTINIVEYNNPVFNSFKVVRCNTDGSENIQGNICKLTFAYECSLIEGRNVVDFEIYWKKTTDSKYNLFTTHRHLATSGSTGEYLCMFPADSSFSYNVMVIATDLFGQTPMSTILSTGYSVMHWLKSGLGLAIGKLAEITNVLDIGFKTRFFGGILLMTLENGTDVDNLKTTNIYKVFADDNIQGMPEDGVGGVFQVWSSDGESSVQQQFKVSDKTNPRTYERAFLDGSWGDWIQTTLPIQQIVRAMSTSYNLETTVTKGENYSSASGSAYLVGNNLRININATRKESASSGNISNETMATFTIDTNGKVKGMYVCSATTSTTGAALLAVTDNSISNGIITFNVALTATIGSGSEFGAYFSMPVTIDISKY